jgi:putative RecB family exonuclease
LFAVVRAYLEYMERGRFVYRPGFHCSMCDYAGGACREWAP